MTEFEARLKKNAVIKKFMEMSPSIPNGFDMNCTKVDVDDFSTIICQTLLSNDHILGLKEQGYMNLESKMEKYQHRHVYKQSPYEKKSTLKPGPSNTGSLADFDGTKLDELDHDKSDSGEKLPESRVGAQ